MASERGKKEFETSGSHEVCRKAVLMGSGT